MSDDTKREYVSEREYMARHDRQVAEGRYWATYDAVLVAAIRAYCLDTEAAHDTATAAAERAHGTLAAIRGEL